MASPKPQCKIIDFPIERRTSYQQTQTKTDENIQCVTESLSNLAVSLEKLHSSLVLLNKHFDETAPDLRISKH